MRPVLSVVIPTYNRRETLINTIESWMRHSCRVPIELVVVDDGSDDGTGEYLAAKAASDPRLKASQQEHAGPARARNRALAQAQGRLVLFGGDDIRPAEGLADGHVEAHEGLDASGFVLGRTEWDPQRPVTPVMRHITGFGGQQFRYGYLADGQRLGFKYFYGSNLSLSRESLASLPGPFDTSFGGAALEDADLGYRLMGTRPKIRYQAGLLAWHDHPYDLARFAQRQYRVGLATASFVAKHPEIAAEFGWALVTQAIATSRGRANGKPVMSLEEIARLEKQVLAAFESVEHLSHRALDRIYFGLFWYFQAKGMAESRVPASELAPVLSLIMESAMTSPIKSAVRDRSNGLAPETRETLGLAVKRLAAAQTRRGLAADLRWRLSMRVRETLYAFQSQT